MNKEMIEKIQTIKSWKDGKIIEAWNEYQMRFTHRIKIYPFSEVLLDLLRSGLWKKIPAECRYIQYQKYVSINLTSFDIETFDDLRFFGPINWEALAAYIDQKGKRLSK